jgi:hypothetical protein
MLKKPQLVAFGGALLMLGLTACGSNGMNPPKVQSADAICAQDFPDVGRGNGFFVGTSLAAWQIEPNLTSAKYTGFCMYPDGSAKPPLDLSGYICLDTSRHALFGGVTDSTGADAECKTIQQVGDSYTMIHATRQ